MKRQHTAGLDNSRTFHDLGMKEVGFTVVKPQSTIHLNCRWGTALWHVKRFHVDQLRMGGIRGADAEVAAADGLLLAAAACSAVQVRYGEGSCMCTLLLLPFG